MLVVGNKADLRNDSHVMSMGGKLVTEMDAQQMVEDVGAVAYVECSALTQEGLKNVFDEAIRAALAPSKKESKSGICAVL